MGQNQQYYLTEEKRAQILLQKGYEARVNNLAYSISLTKEADAISTRMGYHAIHAQAANQLGLLMMIQGDVESAITFSKEALQYFEQIGDLKGIADAKYNLGSVHYKTDNFHVGLEYLLDCLSLYRQLKDHYNESRVLKAMGTIYEFFGDQENAIESYLKAVTVGKLANDLNLESNAYNPLSGIYLKNGQHELAMSIIEKSIAIKLQTHDKRGYAFALYGRAKVHLKLKNYDQALLDLNQSLQIQSEASDKLGLAMAYNKLGLLYFELQRYDVAKEYLLLALQTADQYNINFIRYKSLYNLHAVAKVSGNLEEALNYLERYITIKEVIINTHTRSTIKSYEAIAKIETLEREAKVQKEKTDIIEKKNAELDSFFYRVSHDLKGPIASLFGLHNLIKLEVKDEHSRHYFDMYQLQISRINNIVMDLINLTKLTHLEENKVKVNFNALVDDCIQTYHYLHNFNSIRFIKEIDPVIEFHSEWAIINTILQNLIENAIKYARTDKDPFVRVSINQQNESVRIDVEDNGVGIHTDSQAKVFNMFYRANDRTQGTGLGLYILKRAVERLNGKVDFVSDTKKGTTFTVMLPFK